jgi:hypothetical protein
MAGAHRTAQVGTGGKVALLVAEGAIQHQDFLAAAMAVPLEAPRRSSIRRSTPASGEGEQPHHQTSLEKWHRLQPRTWPLSSDLSQYRF